MRAPMTLPDRPNQRWSLDFVSDALAWGRRFRILAVVDDFTREALALVVDTSIGGPRLVRELDVLVASRGKPAMIVSDNGTEMTSRAVLEWTNRAGIEWHYIARRASPRERLRRKLQRSFARRAPQRGGLRLARPGQGRHRTVAPRRQPRQAPFRPWRAHAERGAPEPRGRRLRNPDHLRRPAATLGAADAPKGSHNERGTGGGRSDRLAAEIFRQSDASGKGDVRRGVADAELFGPDSKRHGRALSQRFDKGVKAHDKSAFADEFR